MSKMTNPVGEPSVSCGFFNSKGDRKYDALQFSSLFDGLINDGIFSSIGMCMVVNATDTNVVKVGTGKAWFNKTWTQNDAVLPIDCGASDQLYERIDAIVIEVNTTANVRDNFIKLIKGTPGTPAANPAMIKENGIYQYPLCYIKRAAGSTKITQAEIVNMIGSPETPFVTGLLEHVDLDTLLGQWRAQLDQFIAGNTTAFNTWFDTIKGQLSEDGANAVTLGGRTIDGFPKFFRHTELTSTVVNDPAYKDAYIGEYNDTDKIISEDGQWWHIIFIPHSNGGNPQGVQMLVPFSGNKLLVRRTKDSLWDTPYDYKQEIENTKQAIENLKNIAVSFKTNVANQINSKLSTALSNETPNATIIAELEKLQGKISVDVDRSSEEITNCVSNYEYTARNVTFAYARLRLSSDYTAEGSIYVKATKKAMVISAGNYGSSSHIIEPGTGYRVDAYKPSQISSTYTYAFVICEEIGDVIFTGNSGQLSVVPVI